MRASKLASFILVLLLVLSMGFAGQAQDTTISFLAPPWGVPPSEDALNAFMAERASPSRFNPYRWPISSLACKYRRLPGKRRLM